MDFFKDYSIYNRSVTANGNIDRSTTQKKWDNPSIYFDGNGDYLSIPASSDFSFGVNPFTIEFWVNATLRTGDWMQPVIGDYASSTSGLLIGLFNNSGSYTGTEGSITCGIGNSGTGGDGVNLGSTTTAFSSGSWNYVALVRNGSFSYLYINGTLVDTRDIGINTQVNFSGNIWRIGTSYIIENGSTRTSLNGGLDDFRVTKGIAREITVPAESFLALNDPYSDDVVLLLSGTEFIPNTSIIQQRNLNLSASPITNSLNGSVIEQRPQMSLLHGGKGVVSGTTVKVPSDMPVARKVRLFEEKSGLLIQEVWSDATGAYVFNGLSDNYYFITAHDHTLEFNGVIQSHVRPEFPV